MNFYERLQDLAKKQGKSFNEIEQELGLGKNTLYSYKKNQPTAQRLKQFSEYFNVSIDYLLGRAGGNYTQYFNSVKENVRANRLKKGLTQKQLAKLIGTSVQDIEEIEDGTRYLTDDALVELALVLEVPVEQLMVDNPEVSKTVQAGLILERIDTNFRYETAVNDINVIELLYKKVRFEKEKDELSDEDIDFILGGNTELDRDRKIELISFENSQLIINEIERLEEKVKEKLNLYDELFGYYQRGESHKQPLKELYDHKNPFKF